MTRTILFGNAGYDGRHGKSQHQDGLFFECGCRIRLCRPSFRAQKLWGVTNICINKRNGTGNDSVILDELLYRERYSIEWTNA